MPDNYNRYIFKRALLICWIIITFFTAIPAALPFIIEENTILSSVPPCEEKQAHGTECAACGLTGGFIKISAGELSEAHALNTSALTLYSLFIANTVVCVFFFGRKILKKL